LHGGKDACFFHESVFLDKLVEAWEAAHVVAVDTNCPFELDDREYIILLADLEIAIYGKDLSGVGCAATSLGKGEVLDVSKLGVRYGDIVSHAREIVVVPADILAIAGSLDINLQTGIAIVVDTIHHRLFGVLHSAIAASVTCEKRFPSVGLGKCAYEAQKK
jgi:hypothetical protein